MPRQGSVARQVAVVARWLEFQCQTRWCDIVLAALRGEKPPKFRLLSMCIGLGPHERLIDVCIGPDGPMDRKQIAAAIMRELTHDELRELARLIELETGKADGGRPSGRELDVQLFRDIEALKRKKLSDRAACRHLVTAPRHRKRYGTITATVLRKRYLETKAFIENPLHGLRCANVDEIIARIAEQPRKRRAP